MKDHSNFLAAVKDRALKVYPEGGELRRRHMIRPSVEGALIIEDVPVLCGIVSDQQSMLEAVRNVLDENECHDNTGDPVDVAVNQIIADIRKSMGIQ